MNMMCVAPLYTIMQTDMLISTYLGGEESE